MPPKKVLFFSCEPGGAEVLIPVIHLLAGDPAYEVIATGYSYALDRFRIKGVVCEEIMPVKKGDFSLFDRYKPDLLITSATSLPERDMSEKHLWHNARLKHIPAFAFLDQWQNYAVRFSGPTPDEFLGYLPDYINCINDIAEMEMIKEGFDPRLFVRFGHPYLSSLKRNAELIDSGRLKVGLGIEAGERIALFASEAIREHFGKSRGYDQHDAIKLFFGIIRNSPNKIRPLIKLHPKETPGSFDKLLSDFGALEPIVIGDQLNPLECIQLADQVYGMTSIMLIEAFVLGKPTFSIQPNLSGPDLLILSRMGYIPRVSGIDSFIERPLMSSHENIQKNFEWNFQSSAFKDFIENMLLERRARVES